MLLVWFVDDYLVYEPQIYFVSPLYNVDYSHNTYTAQLLLLFFVALACSTTKDWSVCSA